MIKAIAYYTEEGEAYTTVKEPQVTIRDYFTEQRDGTYVIGMTLEVIAPTDTTGFAISKDIDDKSQVGFGYSTKTKNADDGQLSLKLSGNWGADWTSGTYVMRFTMSDDIEALYTYGFLDYTLNGTRYVRFATYGKQSDPIEYEERFPIYKEYDTWTKTSMPGN